MAKTESKAKALNLNLGDNNVLTIAIAAVVIVIVLIFFWDRQQQRAVELRRIETRIELLEEWGLPTQQTLQQQQINGQMNNPNAQGRRGRVF